MTNTIQNLAKAFKTKIFFKSFLLFILFIPLIVLARFKETENKFSSAENPEEILLLMPVIAVLLVFLFMVIGKIIHVEDKNWKGFINYSNFFKNRYKKFSKEVEIVEKSAKEIIIFISRKNKYLQFLKRRNDFSVVIVFCLFVLTLLTAPSVFPWIGRLISKFIENLISFNVTSITFWFYLLGPIIGCFIAMLLFGFIIECFIILLFLLFIKCQLFGFDVIYINSLENKIVFRGSFIPLINTQESELKKTSVEMKYPTGTNGDGELYLYLNEGDTTEFKKTIALAVRCSNESKEKIYDILKKYVRERK